MTSIAGLASRYVFYPLWDVKERARRLAELRHLEESQYWPAERLTRMQDEKLRRLLQHAVETTPFYRKHYAGIDLHQSDCRELLPLLPMVSKADVRGSLDDFLSTSFRREELIESRTGGSTGTALTLFFDKTCQEFRNAASMRGDRWACREIGTKTAAIWGNPPVVSGFKSWIRNKLLDRMMYLDTMNIDAASIERFVEEWQREKPEVIFGHAHSIYVLAKFLSARASNPVRPRSVITTSMVLLDNERILIEKVFGCSVFNRYGCEEVGLIAAECEQHAGLHLNSEHLIVECQRRDGTPAVEGEEGEVVVTDLNNLGMPLIRYRIEDAIVVDGRPCACGRTSPLVSRVVGRVADFLVKGDGGLVAGVSLVERTLTAIRGIDQMQLVQDSHELLNVNIVAGEGHSEATAAELREELSLVFGTAVRVQINVMQQLPQERNGKYRFSICKIPSGGLPAGRG